MALAYDFYFLPSWNHVKFPNRLLTRSRSLREFFIGNSVKIFLLRDYGQSQYFYVPITSYFAFSFSIFVSSNNVISLNMRMIFPVMNAKTVQEQEREVPTLKKVWPILYTCSTIGFIRFSLGFNQVSIRCMMLQSNQQFDKMQKSTLEKLKPQWGLDPQHSDTVWTLLPAELRRHKLELNSQFF